MNPKRQKELVKDTGEWSLIPVIMGMKESIGRSDSEMNKSTK